jgi:exopolysaccharide biosynthesis polyprenyl glycosylphosphotransferase
MYWVLFIVVPFTPLCLEFFGFYQRLRSKQSFTSFSQLFRGLAVMALVVSLMVLFARLENGRFVLGVGGFFVFVLIFLRDRILRNHLKLQEIDDNAKERIVMAGTPAETSALLEELDGEVKREWIVVGHFDLETGCIDDFYELLKAQSVGRVVFSPKGTEFGKVATAVEACELQGVEAWISASFIRTQIARPTFDVVGDKPMLVLRSTPELSWELMMKGVFDRVAAAGLLLALSWLVVLVYIGIRIASPGASPFFKQKRAGRYGKPFYMWKFRTMVPNAEALLAQTKVDHGNEMAGPVFKLQNDPRVFPFGAFLRKLSIDEIPQFINVVKGDMSLVGPRPLPLYEVEAFEKSAHRRRLSVKPGITCEWQAGGRNTITSFEQWVEMDLRYIDNWSLWLDLKIILRTIPAVLFGKGAK